MIRHNEKRPRGSIQSRALRQGEAQALLRSKGRRITGQRALLLRLIEESKAHLDAEELHRRARRRDPRINLATVYRTLKLLKASGIIEPYYLTHDDRREHFESKPATEHNHFTCVGCGTVIEFESPLVEKVRREVQSRFGVQIAHDSLCFEGYCAACTRKSG